ncbi:MAG: hypothetical protein JW920_07045 [Deltaproteobacteria bacterium]|nr:hypothetical protein [Deltaproteobacteria bacterium]
MMYNFFLSDEGGISKFAVHKTAALSGDAMFMISRPEGYYMIQDLIGEYVLIYLHSNGSADFIDPESVPEELDETSVEVLEDWGLEMLLGDSEELFMDDEYGDMDFVLPD